MSKICAWCGRETNHLGLHLWDHFKPYQPDGFKYFAGNVSMDGKFSAFMSCIYLSSPLINAIRFWRYRKMTLYFGPDPMVLHQLVINGEKLKKPEPKP